MYCTAWAVQAKYVHVSHGSSVNGSSVRVYCDMTTSCGTFTGGLTRVAVLNNETRHQLCTDDFLINENIQCKRSTKDPGCSNIVFPAMNISYSHNMWYCTSFLVWFSRRFHWKREVFHNHK